MGSDMTESPRPAEPERLTHWRLAAFSLPAIPIAAIGMPLLVHVPPFYASQLDMSLGVVGFVFMIARFWDVFTDPVLGILSDKWQTRWGRRRHWIVLSVPIMLVSVHMIFMPPGRVSGMYLGFWLFVLYVGWTLLTLSHQSWGAELSSDYHERNRVQGILQSGSVLGFITVLILPIFIDFYTPDEGVEARRVAAMGWFMIILLPISVCVAVLRVGERESEPQAPISFRTAIGAVLRNQPLRIVLAADLGLGIALGMHTGTFLFLCTHVLQLDEMSGVFLLAYVVAGFLFIPVALRIAEHWEKHKAAANLLLAHGIAMTPILFLPPDRPALTFACYMLFGLTSMSGSFLFRSMIADVADMDAIETGQQRTGLYYAIVSLTSKAGGAIAIWLSYTLLAVVGFDPNAANSDDALRGLRLVYSLPTIVFGIVAWVVFQRYTLSEKVQLENRSILEERTITPDVDGP